MVAEESAERRQPAAAGRAALISLVETIMARQLPEEDLDGLVDEFAAQVPHPRAADLIFWPRFEGLPADPTPEQIVDAALSYRATPLPTAPANWKGQG